MDYNWSRFRDQVMNNEVPQITRVRPVGGYRIAVEFADGAAGEHDLAWALEKVGPMNAPLRDQAFFDRVSVEAGALTWPNGFDLSPWNIRKRMEDAGEIKPARSVQDSTEREAQDFARVSEWFASRAIEVRRVKKGKGKQAKAPDLELLQAGRSIGWCEVKSRQSAKWHAIYEDDEIHAVGEQGKDATFNSLAKYVIAAHDQLASLDPKHVACWVVAIVNHDNRIDVFDFREVLAGDFFAADGRRYATMQGISEGALRPVKFDIDLYLWFDSDEAISITGEAEPERANRTRALFGLTCPRVLWSAQSS